MKHIKLLYFLSIALIIVTGTMCTSCTAEDEPQTINSIDKNLIPDKLEGYYISPNNTQSTIVISEDRIILDFMPYTETVIDFYTENIVYTETSKTFTIHYYNGVDIIIEYILESDDITVVYNDNGVVYQFGQYSKQ